MKRNKFKQYKTVNILLSIAILLIFMGFIDKDREINIMAQDKTQVQQVADEANEFEIKYAKEYEDVATMSAKIQELESKQIKPTVAPVTHSKTASTNNILVSNHPEVEAKVMAATISAFGKDQWEAMRNIITGESNFNPHAVNPHGGACGIGQWLPCSKMLNKCGTLDNIDCQVRELIAYVQQRYGDANTAWGFHKKKGWY